ncbi:MAG TPA: heme-binding protein [Steroidobacteraceae bacterium]|nr:heme-binding protein [Steroidobacteraceae bacterium]
MAVPTVRKTLANAEILSQLGLLAGLAGKWQGGGFNLVARPDFEDQSATFLQLSLTSETLEFDPITAAIPNRGFLQPDIELFGLTYLQKISDATTGGALHIEPGIWITQPATSQPQLSPPPSGGQLIARMGNIPHGNSILAQGSATSFTGPPVIGPATSPLGGGNPAFSSFPSFNSTPLTPQGNIIFAAGNTEALSKPGGGFPEYTLANPPTVAPPPPNTRTPQGNSPPVLPPSISQALVNDPIILLQQQIQQQIAEGYEFEGAALNICSAATVSFYPAPFLTPPSPFPPPVPVSLPQFGGGIENLGFLGPNALSALVYATFWIEKLTHPERPSLRQLQYAQMVLLNFPGRGIPGTPSFSWPHVSVSTLQQAVH